MALTRNQMLMMMQSPMVNPGDMGRMPGSMPGGMPGTPQGYQQVDLPQWSEEQLDEFKEGEGLSGFGQGRGEQRGLNLGELFRGKNPKFKGAIKYTPKGASFPYTISVGQNDRFYAGDRVFKTRQDAEAYLDALVASRGY